MTSESDDGAKLREGRHRRHRRPRTQAQRDALQAGILGVNDGLISTLALILGVAGAGSSPLAVRIAGVAGLIAGACSLAASQYIAARTRSERRRSIVHELHGFDRLDRTARERVVERELIERGIGRASARAIGSALVTDVAQVSMILGLLRYGFNPRDHSSPLRSTAMTFVTSAAGALVPILPWFFLSGRVAILSSLASASAAAVVMGGILGSGTDGQWLRGALRQLGLTLLAAGITYELGRLFNHLATSLR
ncbi:MAG TPA: VIT1/CCC1 transporter family protein [Candidatus Dormibacteraeota bacterium]|nr:VIT1/CCC1 transporter family protein [Candidatus Dormibacteraeota bacterium]